jgi:hypothetical protein
MPTLDITDKIEVLGDYFSDSETDSRVITTFKMYADYEKLVNKAFEDTKKYFNKLSSDIKYNFEDPEICSDYKDKSWYGKSKYT